MLQFWQTFFTQSLFIPHGHCYLWKPGLVGLHIVCDALIALSYYSIPVTLAYFARKRSDFPYPSIVWLFGAFIIACGTTHVMEIWTLWHPTYWLSGFLKAITALISLYTAMTLMSLVPLALALPSPKQLREANIQLEHEITERKMVEEALRKSEQLYRAIVEDQTELISRFQGDGTLTFINEAYCRYFQVKPEQVLTSSYKPLIYPEDEEKIAQLFSPEDEEKIAQLLNSLTLENPVAMIEHPVKVAGEVRWMQWINRAIYDQQGNFLEYQSVGRDITERNQAEEALRKSEERWQLALAGNNDGIWDWNTNTGEIFLSTRLTEMLGYEHHELRTHIDQWLEVLHLDDKERVMDILQAYLTRKLEQYVVEYRLSCKNGSYKWMLARGQAQWDEAGKPIRMVGSLQDISDRKLAEEALQQQFQREQLLGAITQRIRNSLNLEKILDITVTEVRQVLSTDRVIIFCFEEDWNGKVIVESIDPRFTPILGQNIYDPCFEEKYILPYQEGRVKAIEDIYTASLNPCHIDLLSQFQVRANLVVPILNQQQLWGLLIAHQCSEPRQWQHFEIDLLTSIASQVAIAIQQSQLYQQTQSHAQQLEQTLQELQTTQAQLIHSEKMSSLGQLVAGVAHEINNPINFICGNLSHAQQYTLDLLNLIQLYQEYYPDPAPEITSFIEEIELDFIREDTVEIFSSMKNGTERISNIVLSLRNFSRLDEAQMKWVDIHSGIDNTLLLLAHRLETKHQDLPNIQVIKDYGNLPNVLCYPGQLNQVFMNILANAIDALEQDQQEHFWTKIKARTIWIGTEVLYNSNQVLILISDNGCGMTPEIVNRLYDPFFTTKPVGSGTGLGMAISYQIIVEKHRGSLQCISAANYGTSFLITIPIKQD
jgi:two-component system NtrC family sensor kinase